MKNFIPAILALLFLFGGNILHVYAQITYTQSPPGIRLFDGTIPTITIEVPGLNAFCLSNSYLISGVATLNVPETELEFNYNSNSGYSELPTSGIIHVGGTQIKRADNSGDYTNVEQDSLTGDDTYIFNIKPYQEPLYAIIPYCINPATNLAITFNDLAFPNNFLSLQNNNPLWLYETCDSSYASSFPECDIPTTPTTTPTTTLITNQNEINLIFIKTIFILLSIFTLILFTVIYILKPFIYVRK